MSNQPTVINQFDFYDCKKLNKIEFFWLLLDYMAESKADMFLKTKFTGSDDLNKLLKDNKWYLKFKSFLLTSLKYGNSSAILYTSRLTGKTCFKVVNMLTCQYYDDILIQYSGTNMDIYPDTAKVYDYYEFNWDINKNVITYKYGEYVYKNEYWNLDITVDNRKLDFNKIPVVIFKNNVKDESMFKNTLSLFNLCWTHIIKIDKDVKLNTTKWRTRLRGMPTSTGFLKTLKQIEDSLEQSSLITDDMQLINPNSQEAFEKWQSALQTDQLWYGFKMSWGLLKEMCKIAITGGSKTSAQQNTVEIAQENKLIDNNNSSIQLIWENQLEEFALLLLEYDSIVTGTKIPYKVDIKCNVELTKDITQIAQNQQNNLKPVKKEVNNGRD